MLILGDICYEILLSIFIQLFHIKLIFGYLYSNYFNARINLNIYILTN
jgi:hypothetical protein